MATPSAARQIIYNKFIDDVYRVGMVDLLDMLYPLASADRDFAKQSAINGVKWQAVESSTPNTTPVFAPDQGFASDFQGISTGKAYVQAFLPTAAGLKFTRNSHCFGFYCFDDVAADNSSMCGMEMFALNPRSASNTCRVRSSNTTTDPITGVTSSIGMWILNRNNSLNYDVWHDSVKIGTVTRNSSPITVSNFTLCMFNGDSTRQYSTRRMGDFFAGGALQPHQIRAYTDSNYTKMHALGQV